MKFPLLAFAQVDGVNIVGNGGFFKRMCFNSEDDRNDVNVIHQSGGPSERALF